MKERLLILLSQVFINIALTAPKSTLLQWRCIEQLFSIFKEQFSMNTKQVLDEIKFKVKQSVNSHLVIKGMGYWNQHFRQYGKLGSPMNQKQYRKCKVHPDAHDPEHTSQQTDQFMRKIIDGMKHVPYKNMEA